MNQTVKIGLSYGIPVAIAMAAMSAWRAEELTAMTIAGSIVGGIIGGAVGGVMFGVVMKLMMAKLFAGITIDIGADEKLIREAGANHFKGAEGVGGKLVLTNKRLIFKSHKYNVQNHEAILNIDQIRDLRKVKTLGIVNNGLLVELNSQVTHRFVVNSPAEWISAIQAQRIL